MTDPMRSRAIFEDPPPDIPFANALRIKRGRGDAATNPLVSIVRKHAGDVVRYASEFGLTALARARLARGVNARPLPVVGKFEGLLG
jgi:hypothetical protein